MDNGLKSSRESEALRFDEAVIEFQRRHAAPARAVAGVSLTVRKGQVHGLIGESGCGKSTLARAATGLVELTSGSIVFEGQPVSPLNRGRRAPHFRRLQMVFQDPKSSLNPRRRVGDQLEDVFDHRAESAPGEQGSESVKETLEAVGLPADAARRFPAEFSGGQCQRICIARALMAQPSVIIADEPISALDASAQAQIANLLVLLARDRNLGILFISHDLAIVRHVADTITVMYLGKIVESSAPEPLWREPMHPYSEALIAASPARDGAGRIPTPLPGEIPDPSNPPSGCRFHPRCRYALTECETEEPILLPITDDRHCACWLRTGSG